MRECSHVVVTNLQCDICGEFVGVPPGEWLASSPEDARALAALRAENPNWDESEIPPGLGRRDRRDPSARGS